jgi:uncharacterized protein (TIGR01777 family)
MRIFITGGTGLIGRQLCRALTADGHELTVLSRQSLARVRHLCGPRVNAVPDLQHWEAAGCDAVINLAGEPIADRPWTAARQRKLWDSRVTLTEQLVARLAVVDARPRVLLSGSAIGYYGDTGAADIDEQAPPGHDFSAQLCGAWENAARLAEGLGVRVCLLRTGLVLAPRGGLLARLLPVFRAGLGGRLGNGRQYMSWIHVDDYVSAVRFLLRDASLHGACNMTAPQPATNAAFTAALAAALGKPARLPVPALVLRAALGARAPMLLGGQRVLPRRLEAAGFAFAWPALPDALQQLLAGR